MKNSVKTRFWVIIGSLIFLSFSFGLIFSENSYAKVKSEEDLWKLALFQGVPVCYSGYANDSIDKGSFTTIDTDRIFNQSKKISGSTFGKEDASTVFLPTYVYSFASDTNLEKWSTDNGQRDKDSDFSCKQVFNGWDANLKGLKDLYTLPTTFEGWGYEAGQGKIEVGVGINNSSGYKVEGGKMVLTLMKSDTGHNIIQSCDSDIIISAVDASSDADKYAIKCVENPKSIVVGRKDIVEKYISDGADELSMIEQELISPISLDMECIVRSAGGGCLPAEDVVIDDVVMTINLLAVGHFNVNTTDMLGRTKHVSPRQSRRDSGMRSMLEIVFDEERLDVDFSSTSAVNYDSYSPIGGSKTSAAKRMLYLMDSVKSLPALKRDEQQEITYQWTNSYIYSLYHYYLQDAMAYYNGKKAGNILIGGGEDGCGGSVADGWTYVFRNAKEEGEDGVHTFCKVEIQSDILSEVEGLHVSVVDMHEQNGAMKRGTLKEVLDWFKSDAAGTLEKDEYTNLKVNDNGYLVGTAEVEQSATEDQGENASGTVTATCQSSGGAGAVGWIVCPILEWMGNSATHLYTDYVEPRLKINPKLFQTLESGNENPTQNAWGTFQTIANVVFIILLLVVIFSQLTGIGIDNYGIKRILPKLIVVAILVNLSYLICVICVDLSNILGGSLKGLFDSLGASLGDIEVNTGVASTSALGNDSWIPVVLFGILVTFIIVGAASIVFNPAILLTLLISGLGVVISVLFIFVLFAVREAAIVVLTVVAPIAFVCYALPNTKKLFDKWLKAWEGLLLVYPICGLLIGGGDYISRLLITVEGAGTNETGFFPLMTAMVVGIAPIFFIPTLLKGSFAAMGNIGAKVSGIGKTLSGRATKAATNSEINKNAQRMGAERRNRIRAGLDQNGELTGRAQRRIERTRRRAGSNIPIIGGLIRGTARGQAKAQASRIAAAKKDFSAGESANAMLMGAMATTGMSAAGGADKYFGGLLEEAADRGDMSGFDAALTAATESGYMKPKDIASMVRKMSNDGKLNNLNDSAWWQRAANKHNAIMSTDYEMLAWARAGGEAGTGQKLGGYGDFASATDAKGRSFINVDDIKQDDISKMSGDSLAGMLASGKINKGMAQQMLANGAGLTQDKRVMLGAVASGVATADGIVRAGGSGKVSDGASVYKNESKALMGNAGASTWNDNGTSRQIQSIHTENTNNTGWTGEVASTAEVEGWMAPQAQEVVVRGQGGGALGNPGAPGGGGADGSGAPGGGSEELNRYNQFLESREGENQQARERRGAGEGIFTVPREESYDGETNTNSETGNARTRSVFDLYPRQAGESQADYTQRLRNMSQMRSRAEANPPEPQIRFNDTYRTRRAEPARGSAIPSDLNERRRLFPRREGETTASYGARLRSDNPWGNS